MGSASRRFYLKLFTKVRLKGKTCFAEGMRIINGGGQKPDPAAPFTFKIWHIRKVCMSVHKNVLCRWVCVVACCTYFREVMRLVESLK